MILTMQLTAGQQVSFNEVGNFFRMLQAGQPLTVTFYKNGAQKVQATSIGGGYAESFNDIFDSYTLMSPVTQTVQFVARLGSNVRYDTPPNGSVSVTNSAGAFTQAQATVTSASALLAAASTMRRYLLIQNNDATGILYVTLDGSAATALIGLKIAPGASLELQGYCTTGAINAIGSIASNANIVLVQG